MPLLKLASFGGVIPVSGDRALPEGFATQAINTWLYGLELRGVRPWTLITNISQTTRKVFRIPPPNQPAYDVSLAGQVWVQFDDPDTDIIRGATVDDQYKRWYFCSPSTGPMFNTYARLQTGLAMYKLGVIGPNVDLDANKVSYTTPVISSISGGAAPVLTRAYLYTWVNEFGEESSPSLPVTGAGNTGAIWNIAGIDDPLANPQPGYALYTKKYLYRTITGTSGATTYYRIGEVALGTTTYADDQSKMTDAVLAQNLQLESTSWQPPPTTLKGWIAMPNGFLIGFVDNTVYMSEAFHFHAWPTEYKYTTEYPIVGLGVLGTTCVILTQGFPATATGTKPATMAFTKATTGEPALHRGNIVSTPQGVLYASQNGLMLVGPNGIQNATQQFITREEWMRDYAPQNLRCCRYQNGYLALRQYPGVTPPNSAFYLDPSEMRVALTEFSEFDLVENVHTDVWSGEVFVLAPGKLYRWDPPTNDLWPVLWKSKEYQFPYQENFSAYSLYWDQTRYASNSEGTDIIAANEVVRLRVIADRRIVYDEAVPRNGRPVRLPSGYKADIWQFEIRARAPVYSLHIASTVKELKGA